MPMAVVAVNKPRNLGVPGLSACVGEEGGNAQIAARWGQSGVDRASLGVSGTDGAGVV